MPPVKRADRIPMQILKPHREPQAVSDTQTMREDGRTETLSLMFREKVEFTKSHVSGHNLE
jgi:hypothetical protein